MLVIVDIHKAVLSLIIGVLFLMSYVPSPFGKKIMELGRLPKAPLACRKISCLSPMFRYDINEIVLLLKKEKNRKIIICWCLNNLTDWNDHNIINLTSKAYDVAWNT